MLMPIKNFLLIVILTNINSMTYEKLLPSVTVIQRRIDRTTVETTISSLVVWKLLMI